MLALEQALVAGLQGLDQRIVRSVWLCQVQGDGGWCWYDAGDGGCARDSRRGDNTLL